MSGVTFQPHSQYSTDIARAWRTDNVQQDIHKGAFEDSISSSRESIGYLFKRESTRKIITPDDKEHAVLSYPSSSSSSSSSSSTTSVDPLALILSKMDGMSTKIDAMTAKMDRMEKRLIIQDKQISSLVDMSCPDKLLSMIFCGYSKTIRDSNLTEADKQFLAQNPTIEVENGTHSQS